MQKYIKWLIVLGFLIPMLLGLAWTTSFQIEQAYNGGGFAPYVESAATNTVGTGLSATHYTSGTPSAGIGTGFNLVTQTSTAGNTEIGGVVAAVSTDVTGASEDFDLVFYSMAGGATAVERFRMLSTGAATAPGKYTGTTIDLTASSNQVVFDSDNGTSTGTLTWTPTTTNRTITLPDSSGTVMLTGAGILGLSSGGTNANLTADDGAIVYSDATKLALLAATATAGQIVRSGSNTAPTWSTATYPATVGANEILYASGANVIAGITAGASGVLVTDGSNVPSIATDIPTAVTIGAKYIYRADGTDVPLADGGTNNSLTADNGAIPYSDASKIALLAATATANQMLQSGSNAAPTWSTATYPATTGANEILYSSGANVVAGITAAANGILVTDGSNVPSIATDIPTAVTIGGQYIYRATGTDVPLADGGTNGSLTASAGGIVWTDASRMAILAGTATAGQMLQSGASVTPSWSTATYPATVGANEILYASSANVIAGITAGASGVLVTDGSNVPSIATDIPTAVTIGAAYIYRAGGTDVPQADGGTGIDTSGVTDGQLLIGNTAGNVFALATVTGTANQVTVANGASSITLSTPQDIDTAAEVQFAKVAADNFFWEDEFVIAAHAAWTTHVSTGSVAIQNVYNGLNRYTTGAVGTNEESEDWNDLCMFVNTMRPTIEVGFQLEQTATTEVEIGLKESEAVGTDDYIYFFYDASAANTWSLEASKGGATASDVGAVADASYHVFRLEWTSDTELEWFIDGASQGTITTSANIPIVNLQPAIGLRTEDGNARYIDVDYYAVWQDRT